MGHKSGRQKQKRALARNTTQQAQSKGRRQMLIWSGTGVLLALVGAGGYVFSLWKGREENFSVSGGGILVDYTDYQLREQGTVLSPTLFRGKVAEAYQVAQDIPKVLDQLYCYCRCRENFGHKSLLSCYTNTHAST